MVHLKSWKKNPANVQQISTEKCKRWINLITGKNFRPQPSRPSATNSNFMKRSNSLPLPSKFRERSIEASHPLPPPAPPLRPPPNPSNSPPPPPPPPSSTSTSVSSSSLAFLPRPGSDVPSEESAERMYLDEEFKDNAIDATLDIELGLRVFPSPILVSRDTKLSHEATNTLNSAFRNYFVEFKKNNELALES